MMSKKINHWPNGSFLSMLLLVVILMFTISNYFTFNNIQSRGFQTVSETPQSSLNIYQDSSLRDLRKNALIAAETDRQRLLNSSMKSDHKEFYKNVKMEAHCPIKERIGESGDGGKFVCNPKAAKKDCTLISLGLHNQIGYDEQIFNATGRKCVSLGADKDPQNAKTQKKYSEMNGHLFAGMIPTELTVPEMMQKSGRTDVDLLKIDIEGGEFTGLEPLIKDYFVCQIFIEIHGAPSAHLQMMQTIAKYGFRIFSIEPNPYCTQCCEYSYINEMCLHQFGAVPLAITIPQK